VADPEAGAEEGGSGTVRTRKTENAPESNPLRRVFLSPRFFCSGANPTAADPTRFEEKANKSCRKCSKELAPKSAPNGSNASAFLRGALLAENHVKGGLARLEEFVPVRRGGFPAGRNTAHCRAEELCSQAIRASYDSVREVRGQIRAATRPTAGRRSYAVRRFECRMIPCAELGGRSLPRLRGFNGDNSWYSATPQMAALLGKYAKRIRC
jgi:hypothetical protein